MELKDIEKLFEEGLGDKYQIERSGIIHRRYKTVQDTYEITLTVRTIPLENEEVPLKDETPSWK